MLALLCCVQNRCLVENGMIPSALASEFELHNQGKIFQYYLYSSMKRYVLRQEINSGRYFSGPCFLGLKEESINV